MGALDELRADLAAAAVDVADRDVLRSAIRLLREVPDGDFVWITPSGREVRLDDLPIDTIAQIAQKHLLGWMGLLSYPATNPDALWDLYEACCRLVNEAPVERPTTAGDFLRHTELLAKRKPDLPTLYDEDGIPLEGSGPKTD
jgi:hypothetical protein